MALTDYVIMPGEDWQAVCDAVRAKTGSAELLKSGDVAAAVEGIQAAPKGTVKRCCVKYSEGEIYPYFLEGMTWADLIDSTHNAIYMTAAFVDAMYQPAFTITESGTVKLAPTPDLLTWEVGGATMEVLASDPVVADYTYYCM